MSTILGLLGAAAAAAVGLAGVPARQLASFMDDIDEVWLVDPFLDHLDSNDHIAC